MQILSFFSSNLNDAQKLNLLEKVKPASAGTKTQTTTSSRFKTMGVFLELYFHRNNK
jgi:hypothetical protein